MTRHEPTGDGPVVGKVYSAEDARNVWRAGRWSRRYLRGGWTTVVNFPDDMPPTCVTGTLGCVFCGDHPTAEAAIAEYEASQRMAGSVRVRLCTDRDGDRWVVVGEDAYDPEADTTVSDLEAKHGPLVWDDEGPGVIENLKREAPVWGPWGEDRGGGFVVYQDRPSGAPDDGGDLGCFMDGEGFGHADRRFLRVPGPAVGGLTPQPPVWGPWGGEVPETEWCWAHSSYAGAAWERPTIVRTPASLKSPNTRYAPIPDGILPDPVEPEPPRLVPTEPGWWWGSWNGGEPVPREAYDRRGDILVPMRHGLSVRADDDDWTWLGPCVPPEVTE